MQRHCTIEIFWNCENCTFLKYWVNIDIELHCWISGLSLSIGNLQSAKIFFEFWFNPLLQKPGKVWMNVITSCHARMSPLPISSRLQCLIDYYEIAWSFGDFRVIYWKSQRIAPIKCLFCKSFHYKQLGFVCRAKNNEEVIYQKWNHIWKC